MDEAPRKLVESQHRNSQIIQIYGMKIQKVQ